MLSMYFVQHGFNLGDQACEDALLDSPSLRRFVGIDLGRERVPDATTLLEFRRLLEKHSLGEALFAEVGAVLQTHGMKVGTGTIVDATLISAPSSTKNADKARDPEMHQTRKRQQRYLGMELHIGVDSATGLVHSAVVTAANVHDKRPLPDLLHGQEEFVYGDCACACQQDSIASKAPKAQDLTNQRARKGGVTEGLERMVNPRNHGFALASSMCSAWSSGCGGSAKCATAAWPRTPRGPSWHWGGSTFTSRENAWRHECVCSAQIACCRRN